jgi:hypothetical protein
LTKSSQTKVYTYFDEDGSAQFDYIRLSELPRDVRALLVEWMNNRTTQILELTGLEVGDCVQFEDYQCFLQEKLD